MTTKKNLVKSMLMSAATAGIFSFSFVLTSCNDDDMLDSGIVENVPELDGYYANYEPYGLTYHNFDSENDVQILDADTTEIAVKKSLADKLGITDFENHPLGIWDSPSHKAYGRKGLKQELVGDTYIIKVGKVTTAELIGDKAAQLTTDLYVNTDAQAVATRAAGDNIPDFAAKYVDNDNKIHPAVILYTDPYGYDKSSHLPGDRPAASATRAAQSGEYQYATAEELLKSTRGTIHPRILAINDNVEFEHKFQLGSLEGDSITVKGNIPVEFNLNYFLTLNGGIKWAGIIPYPSITKFETGMDGNFGFHPELSIGFSKKLSLPEDKEKVNLATFNGYTFTFMVGYIPVAVSVNPTLFLKFDASVEGAVQLKCEYNYSNWFKAGVRYDGDWHTFSDFEEEENEFKLFEPQLVFKAEAGVGLFLGAEVIIDGVAGPEVAVGPRLGAEASIKVSPTGFDWNAEVNLTVQAVAGIKLKVLGYEIAEWDKTFDIVGPWTLLKFPSDGSEHKSFKEKRSEYIETEIDKMVKTINEKYDKTFMNRIEQVIMMEMALYGGTHDEYLTKIYESFCDVLHGEMRNKMFDAAKSDPIKALEADADNAEVRQRIKEWFDRIEFDIKNAYENRDIRAYMEQIRQGILDSPYIGDYMKQDPNIVGYINQAMNEFQKEFNRVPDINEKDFKWVGSRAKELYIATMVNPAKKK